MKPPRCAKTTNAIVRQSTSWFGVKVLTTNFAEKVKKFSVNRAWAASLFAAFLVCALLFETAFGFGRLPSGKLKRIESAKFDSSTGSIIVQSTISDGAILADFERRLRAAHRTIRWSTLGRIRGPLLLSFEGQTIPACLFYEYDQEGYTVRRIEVEADGVLVLGEQRFLGYSVPFSKVYKTGDMRSILAGHWVKTGTEKRPALESNAQ